jgi:hypothetical protein
VVNGIYILRIGPADCGDLLVPGTRHRHRRREPQARRRGIHCAQPENASDTARHVWLRLCPAVFNRANYGSYTTNIDRAAYGQPGLQLQRRLRRTGPSAVVSRVVLSSHVLQRASRAGEARKFPHASAVLTAAASMRSLVIEGSKIGLHRRPF